jgi:CHAD domain-containing protein
MARAEVKQLRELQDCLGDLHDARRWRRALKSQWRYRRAATDLSGRLKAEHHHYTKTADERQPLDQRKDRENKRVINCSNTQTG